MIYDMTILMCAQKLTDASLIYRTGPKTKTSKMKKTKKNKQRICSEEDALLVTDSVKAVIVFVIYVMCYFSVM